VQEQQNILIQRLKQQPRHGRAESPEDRKRYLQNQLEGLSAELPGLSKLWTEYTTIVDGVITSNTTLGMGLNNVLAVQNTFAAGIKKLTADITILEERTKTLTKGYGLTLKTSQNFSKELRTIAISARIGEEKLFNYATQLKGMTAGMLASTKVNKVFANQLLKGQQYMQNNLEITEEAAQGYEYYATAVAKSGIDALAIQDKMAAAIGKATGLDGLQIQKELTEDIGNLTADLQLQYSRIPGSLELAVLKSKALGMNMETLHSAGETLLNIESSIGQEMEYQLLTGKRLLTQDGKSLTNAYRMATLQGDANKQAELMNQLVKTQGPMLEKNLYARKKAAELLGTDEATLARSIQKQKLISKIGAERLMELKSGDISAVAAELKTKGVSQDDITKLLELSDTRTTEQRQTDYLESIATSTALAAGIDLEAVRKDTLAGGKTFESMLTQFNGSQTTMKTVGELAIFSQSTKIVTDGLGELSKWIPIFGDKVKSVIDRITKLLPNISTVTAETKATGKQDALVMNDGLIRFHQDDKFMRVNDSTMIAGTNVNGNRQLARAINGGGSIDYGKMAQAIAMALQNIKVEAKVTQDMLFAATKMNDKRRF